MKMYELPAGWEWRRLGGLTMPKELWNRAKNPRATFRYIDISSIDNEAGRIARTRETAGSQAPSRAKRIIRGGDVLFATTRPYLKNVAIVPSELDGDICSTGFCVLRPRRADSDRGRRATSEWIYYACRSDLVVDQVVPNQEKSAYPAVSNDEVLAAQIPVPPLEEQRRIVARIEELTSRLRQAADLHREAAAELSACLPGVYRSAYERLCREFDTIPLAEAGKVQGGGTPSKNVVANWGGTIPWISPKAMKTWHITDSAERVTPEGLGRCSAKLISASAVLFVVRGMILARNVPVAIAVRDVVINQDMKAVVPRKDIDCEFLASMVRGAEGILLARVEVAGHGTRKLETDRWGSVPIPVPPKRIQVRVVKRLKNIRAKAEGLSTLQQAIRAELDSFMPALLAKAFRGDL